MLFLLFICHIKFVRIVVCKFVVCCVSYTRGSRRHPQAGLQRRPLQQAGRLRRRTDGQERLSRTTAQKCAIYERKSRCQREKDGREVHSRRGGVRPENPETTTVSGFSVHRFWGSNKKILFFARGT